MVTMRRVFSILLMVSACGSQAFAQGSAGALPPSFASGLSLAAASSVNLPPLDNGELRALADTAQQQAQLAHSPIPYQIAEPRDVHLALNNAGRWETLPKGDRIWRLRIVSPGATDIYLQYDQWRLVKPCELWLYNDDQSMLLGPYTYLDNWDGTNITPLTTGEAVTLEYHVPAGVDDIGDLSIALVLHGFRHFLDRHAYEANHPLDAFGASMPCMINVQCFPDWQDEKLSVALTANPLGGVCSGAMLNNTLQNGDPLFLTANHCLNGNYTNWVFYFNYQSPQCNPNQDGDYSHTIVNATVVASYNISDFALLRLSRTRPNTTFVPRYEAWDHYDLPASRSIGIHHPQADVKKISYAIDPTFSTDWNGVGPNSHWGLNWSLGTAEPGSSGSPLWDFDYDTIVGQLHGGITDCNFTNGEYSSYGKLAVSWEGGGSYGTRLRDFLDPNNTGAMSMGAFQPVGPPNDTCGSGVPYLTTVPFSYSGNTTYARDNAQGACVGQNTAGDVLFTLQFPCDYVVTASTCGSGFDTQITVFRTTSWGGCYASGGFSVGCNDDFCGLQSQVTFTAEAGQFYTVSLDGYGSARGAYTINFTGYAPNAPANATCPGSTISTVPFFEYTTNVCAGDNLTPTCQSFNGEDVVYNWTSPYRSAMRAKTCLNGFDTILETREQGSCPGTYLTGCNDDACGDYGLGSSVVFDAVPSIPYYFHVDGYGGAQGITSFELEVFNDDCSSPWVVSGVPFNTFGDTRPARDDFATYIGPSSKEVFFRYTSPSCQTIGVSLCSLNGYDTALEVRTGGSCPGSTLVAWNDDYCGLQSQLSFSAEANRTYYIIVAGYSVSEGPYAIQVYNIPGSPAAPLADVCPGIYVNALPFVDYGNTNCMNTNYNNCVTTTSREMVYTLNFPQCYQMTVSLCGSGYDTGLGVYGGVCPNIAPLIVCNDDYCGLQSQVTFTAQANTNYQILVHGFSTYSGPYVINVTGTPCAVPPSPVTDLVVKTQTGSGNVNLNWTATANADLYHVFRSSDQATLFNAGNEIGSVGSPAFTCSGCANDAATRSFFGVIAENTLAAPPLMQPKGDSQVAAVVEKKAENAVAVVMSPAFDHPFPDELGMNRPAGKMGVVSTPAVMPNPIPIPEESLLPMPAPYAPAPDKAPQLQSGAVEDGSAHSASPKQKI